MRTMTLSTDVIDDNGNKSLLPSAMVHLRCWMTFLIARPVCFVRPRDFLLSAHVYIRAR